MSINDSYKKAMHLILNECGEILDRVDPDQTEAFIEMLLSSRRVFFIGVGRVRLSLEAMAKRFAHLGIETHMERYQ